MRKLAVEQAVGQTLCHDITAIRDNGFKGVAFKRGHVIQPSDIEAFKTIGKYHVYVWEDLADEIHEDDAALEIARAICGPNLEWTGPSEGKVTVSSKADGVLVVNRKALLRVNQVADVTVACLPNYSRLSRGDKLAGARIIPLVTDRDNIRQVARIADEAGPVLSVLPFRALKCALIMIGSEIYDGRVQDRFAPIMGPRLEGFGGQVIGSVKCPDDTERILAAIQKFRTQGADLILLSGGMSVDPDDLTPDAIRTSGADLITYGVPMQPGNMLMLAKLDQTWLVGVPGASIHSPTTSLDVFLPRIFAGIELETAEIAGLGEGGFCQQCKVCHYPVCYFGRGQGGC